MKDHTSQREQLREELLSQDASLAWQKEKFLWLFEHVDNNIPEIDQDPLFFWRLKDKLRYHLITKYEPAPQPTSWQKFMLYGFPSLALGLALIYIIPWFQETITSPELDKVIFSGYSEWEQIREEPIENTSIREKKLPEENKASEIPLPQQNQATIINEKNFPSWSQEVSSQEDDNSTLRSTSIMNENDNVSSQAMYRDNTNFDYYTRGTSTKAWQLDYNVSYDENDTSHSSPMFLDGKLLIRSCNKLFLLDNPISLSRWPGLRAVSASAYDNETSNYDLVLTIEQDDIVSIEGRDKLCL